MNVGILANNSKKSLIEDFCMAYKGILQNHELYATDTTGRRIEAATSLHVHKFLPGALGGDRQFMEMITRDELDLVILFYNPAMTNPREAGVDKIIQVCDQYSIPCATNIATAECLVHSLDRGDLEWRESVRRSSI